jgi:AmmeMemoRadiSam system protein B
MTVPPGPGLPLPARPPAVAGAFYPDDPAELGALVDELLVAAGTNAATSGRAIPESPIGILVPHAGLVYSGLVAAAGWRLTATTAPTIVLLGTNHRAAWLDGVGAWDGGPWWTPLGEAGPDADLTRAVLDLGPPFVADARCHVGEHSLEVQLPFVRRVLPAARIVALSVGAGTGTRAIEAGERLGQLLASRRATGEAVLLAISSDMAHYPAAGVAERVTARLIPAILGLDAGGLAAEEAAVRWDERGVSCGMCGIEPAVLGLAALGAMGARLGMTVATATSADAGGDPRRTVGYLAAAFAG